jgi:hypothetical protein
MMFAVTIIMIMAYETILRQERSMDTFQFRPNQQSASGVEAVMCPMCGELKRRTHSRYVVTQVVWYLVPFYLTWFFPMLTHALSSRGAVVNYEILLDLIAVFMPLQGFMNLCVYQRPEMVVWLNHKIKSSEESRCPSNLASNEPQDASNRRSNIIVEVLNIVTRTMWRSSSPLSTSKAKAKQNCDARNIE